MTTPSLRVSFLWTFLGNAIFAAGQWATIIVITKLGSTRLAGDWTLALSVTSPIFIFAQLKLRIVQATDVRRENRWGEFLGLRVVGLTGAMLVVVGIAAIGYPDRTGALMVVVGLSKAFDSLSDLVYGLEQRHERMRSIAISQTVRGVSSSVLSILVFCVTHSLAWTAGATATIYAGWVCWDLLRIRPLLVDESLTPSWDRSRLWSLFRRVLPLGVVTAIGSLQTNLPRYVLDGYVSRSELGVFGALSYLTVFGGMVVTALAYAALPRLSQLAASQEWPRFRKLIAQLIAISVTLGGIATLLSVLIGEPVLRVVYSPTVAAHSDVLICLAASSCILWSYLFLGASLDALRRFGVQPWIHGASTVVIGIASLLLVPTHAMIGAVIAMALGYGVELALYLLVVARSLRRLEAEVTCA